MSKSCDVKKTPRDSFANLKFGYVDLLMFLERGIDSEVGRIRT